MAVKVAKIAQAHGVAITRLGQVLYPGLGSPKGTEEAMPSGNLRIAERSPVWLVSVSALYAARKGETAQPPPTSMR